MDRFDEARIWNQYADNDMEAVDQLSTFHPPKVEISCISMERRNMDHNLIYARYSYIQQKIN